MTINQLIKWINGVKPSIEKNIKISSKKGLKSYDSGYFLGYKSCLDMIQCHITESSKNT
jgi:hypothetical protein